MFPVSGLNTRFLVSRDHEVISAQRRALPHALIEIEDGTGLGRKVGIAREDSASMLPRAESVGAEPTPQRGAADFGDQTLGDHVLPDLLDGEARERKPEAVRKFAGKRLNLDDEAGGKSGLYARPEAGPQGQAIGRAQIACATC